MILVLADDGEGEAVDRSNRRRAPKRRHRVGRSGTSDVPQRPFKRSSAGKQSTVERVEAVVGRKEHEAAGHADGDADRATVELNCETLAWH